MLAEKNAVAPTDTKAIKLHDMRCTYCTHTPNGGGHVTLVVVDVSMSLWGESTKGCPRRRRLRHSHQNLSISENFMGAGALACSARSRAAFDAAAAAARS